MTTLKFKVMVKSDLKPKFSHITCQNVTIISRVYLTVPLLFLHVLNDDLEVQGQNGILDLIFHLCLWV